MIKLEQNYGKFCVIFSKTRHFHTRIGLYGRQHTDYLFYKQVFFGRTGLIDCLLVRRTWECKVLSEEWV